MPTLLGMLRPTEHPPLTFHPRERGLYEPCVTNDVQTLGGQGCAAHIVSQPPPHTHNRSKGILLLFFYYLIELTSSHLVHVNEVMLVQFYTLFCWPWPVDDENRSSQPRTQEYNKYRDNLNTFIKVSFTHYLKFVLIHFDQSIQYPSNYYKKEVILNLLFVYSSITQKILNRF